LKEGGIRVARFEFVQPTLEDVFIAMIEDQRTLEKSLE
jgi:hypothetical protein